LRSRGCTPRWCISPFQGCFELVSQCVFARVWVRFHRDYPCSTGGDNGC
jgi:hypothetical protein